MQRVSEMSRQGGKLITSIGAVKKKKKTESKKKEEKQRASRLHDYTLPKGDRLRLYNSPGKLYLKQLCVQLGALC